MKIIQSQEIIVDYENSLPESRKVDFQLHKEQIILENVKKRLIPIQMSCFLTIGSSIVLSILDIAAVSSLFQNYHIENVSQGSIGAITALTVGAIVCFKVAYDDILDAKNHYQLFYNSKKYISSLKKIKNHL